MENIQVLRNNMAIVETLVRIFKCEEKNIKFTSNEKSLYVHVEIPGNDTINLSFSNIGNGVDGICGNVYLIIRFNDRREDYRTDTLVFSGIDKVEKGLVKQIKACLQHYTLYYSTIYDTVYRIKSKILFYSD